MDDENKNTLAVTWHDQHPANLLAQTGDWLAMRGDRGAARRYYRAALSVDEGYSYASYRAGKLAFEDGDFETAFQMFMHGVRCLPGHAPTAYLAARAALELKRTDEALGLLSRTIELNPRHSGAVAQLLRLYALAEDWTRVLTLFRDTSADRASLGEGLLWVARAFAVLRRPDDARATLLAVGAATQRRNPALVREIHDLIGDDSPG